MSRARRLAVIGATAAVVGWLTLIVSFFIDRPPCTPLFSAICAPWAIGNLRYVIMLKWIDSTLASAFLALGAAAISVHYLKKQIAQISDIENQRRSAKYSSSRADLAFVLSEICDYLSKSGTIYNSLYRQATDPHSLEPSIERPLLPASVSPVLKELIEYGSPTSRPVFVELITLLQVHDARLRTSISKSETGAHIGIPWVTDMAYYTASFYSKVLSLFGYARYETDLLPQKLSAETGLTTAIHSMDLSQPLIRAIEEKATRVGDASRDV